MEMINKVLFWIDEGIKNVKEHSKDERNTELIEAYYKGFETALKEIKKKTIKIKKEEEEWKQY